jgi:hypothetical protein
MDKVTTPITAEWVADTLAKVCAETPHRITPDEDQVRHIVRLLNRAIETPWTEDELAALRKNTNAVKSDRTKLDSALEILREELASMQSNERQSAWMAEAQAEWETAIRVLEKPRDLSEAPGYFPALSARGPATTPWSVTALTLAVETMRAMPDVGLSPGGPVVTFVRICLRLIYRQTPPPALNTIYEAVKTNLDRHEVLKAHLGRA